MRSARFSHFSASLCIRSHHCEQGHFPCGSPCLRSSSEHHTRTVDLTRCGKPLGMLRCQGLEASYCTRYWCADHVQQDASHLGTITPLSHCQLGDPAQIPQEPAVLCSPCSWRGTDEIQACCCPAPAMAGWGTLQFFFCLFLLWHQLFLHRWPTPWHFSCPCRQSTHSSLGCLSRTISHKTKPLPILSKDMSPPHLPSSTLEPKQ